MELTNVVLIEKHESKHYWETVSSRRDTKHQLNSQAWIELKIAIYIEERSGAREEK